MNKTKDFSSNHKLFVKNYFQYFKQENENNTDGEIQKGRQSAVFHEIPSLFEGDKFFAVTAKGKV